MRVSPCGYYFSSLDQVLEEAKKSTECTHNHTEGIKEAQATAACIYLAKHGNSKQGIKSYVVQNFGYDLDRTVESIRPGYHFDVSCQGSVTESILVFLDSTDYEDTIRLAISLVGDADTQAAIAGSIAYVYYHRRSKHPHDNRNIDPELVDLAREKLPQEMLDIIDMFDKAAE